MGLSSRPLSPSTQKARKFPEAIEEREGLTRVLGATMEGRGLVHLTGAPVSPSLLLGGEMRKMCRAAQWLPWAVCP